MHSNTADGQIEPLFPLERRSGSLLNQRGRCIRPSELLKKYVINLLEAETYNA